MQKLLIFVFLAGHCVWNQVHTKFKIALGKYYSDFNKIEKNAQVREVKEIVTQPLYQDKNGNYGSDLSILVLNEPIHLSPSIHPACIDLNLKNINYQLQEGNLGLVCIFDIIFKNIKVFIHSSPNSNVSFHPHKYFFHKFRKIKMSVKYSCISHIESKVITLSFRKYITIL